MAKKAMRATFLNEAETNAFEAILHELELAEEKHPDWPEDKIHQVAIMVEEAGEAMQAAIDCHYSDGDIGHLKKELAQTGAMCMRALMNLDKEELPPAKPSIDGWLPWNGGLCPVPGGTRVNWRCAGQGGKYSDRDDHEARYAEYLDWRHKDGSPSNIVEYRIAL